MTRLSKHYKHYSAEHSHKIEKGALAKDCGAENELLCKALQGQHQPHQRP